MNAFIALAILAFASSASALNCYFGTSYDGSAPSTYMINCWYCTKTVQKYNSYTVTTFGGDSHCTAPPATTVAPYTGTYPATVASVGTPAWAPIYAWTVATTGLTGTCTNYAITKYITNPTTAAPYTGTYAPVVTGAPVTCTASSYYHICSASGEDAYYASCICCTESCNGGLSCGPPASARGAASSVSYSMVSMLLVAIIGYMCQ